jgi:hypothetical protein
MGGVPGGGHGFFPENPFEPVPPRVLVRAEVEGLVRTRPADVFGRLGEHAGLLDPAEQASLARAAGTRLAIQVEVDGKPVDVLAQVRGVRAGAGTDPEVRASLDAVLHLAEGRVAADALAEVGRQIQGGRWQQAGAQARECLGRLGDEALPEPVAREAGALREVAGVARRSDALEGLRAGLGAEDRLPQVDVGSLPKELRGVAEGLRGLAALRTEAGRPAGVDVSRVKTAVGQLEAGLEVVTGGDRTLAKQVRQDFAVRAFLEGRPGDFRELWPTDGPAEHAAALLRDMKALTLGGGEVATWPAERALPGAPGRGGDSARGPPPGLRPLIPEGSREAWRPPVRGSAREGLPPLEKAAEVGKALRAQAEKGLDAAQGDLHAERLGAQQKVEVAALGVREREAADRRLFTGLEAKLGHPLAPAERAHARYLAALHSTNDQIVHALGKPTADDDDFLKQVAGTLRRPLTPAERARALALRREGRAAAAVAAALEEEAGVGAPPPSGWPHHE